MPDPARLTDRQIEDCIDLTHRATSDVADELRDLRARLAAAENVVEAAQATAEHWTERPWREDREAHAAWADDHQELVERERGVLEIERHSQALEAANAELRERLAAAENGLAEWYRRDRLACANWCDEIGDPSGALLGRIRALAAYDAQKEPTGNHAESSATRGDTNE